MADPYWRFGTGAAAAAPERADNAPRPSFPGYLSSEPSLLQTHHSWNPNDMRGASTDYVQKDMLPLRPGAYGYEDIGNISSRSAPALVGLTTGYGYEDIGNIGSRSAPALAGLTTGASLKGHPVPIEDPALISQRREVALGISPDLLTERPSSLIKVEDISAEESSILFVDGLPTDCTRREVAHLFRPFIGFKEIRVVHKEPRRSGDKASVLCFVEFNDAKCALTAMEALQDYRFDDKKPDTVLRIQFAQFPFRPPSSRDDRRHGDRR